MNKQRSRRLEQALVHLQVAATYLKALSSEERAAAHNLPSNIRRERGAALEAMLRARADRIRHLRPIESAT